MKTISEVKNCLYGKCLVAVSPLEVGTIVQKYQGDIVSWEDVSLDEIRYAILISDKKWMIIKTDARYINHSCSPNCFINDKLEVITVKPVNKGEELTVTYNVVHEYENPGEWDSRWSFKCQCGSKNCQGLIDKYITEDGFKWVPQNDIKLNLPCLDDINIKTS